MSLFKDEGTKGSHFGLSSIFSSLSSKVIEKTFNFAHVGFTCFSHHNAKYKVFPFHILPFLCNVIKHMG